MSDFALGLWLLCLKHGITRKEYATLRELFALLKDDHDGTDALKQLERLLGTVDTLKRHTREEIPHIQIHSKPVHLNPNKLS